MKFTILGHAGLLVEHNGVQLVMDPWTIGSAYWRSWWNFPEPPPELIAGLKPDYVYLTHLHWDHFHGPSLRKFGPETKMLTPLPVTRRMVNDLNYLGFRDVTEIPSGGTVTLGQDFALTSYLFGPHLDSTAVVRGGNVTLLNANDCKIFGLPLAQLLKRHSPIEFVFRSHSNASAIPYCIDGYREKFSSLRVAKDYENEFARFAIHCDARYAIPFASNHCFLHKDTRHYNDTAVVPEAAADRCNELAQQFGAATRAIVMAPGSSWSQSDGFSLTKFDGAARKDYIDNLSEKYGLVLERQYAKEAETIGDFGAFRTYFESLMKSAPRFVHRRIGRFAFRITDPEGVRYWVVDVPVRTIDEVRTQPSVDFTLDVPAVVINDCTRNKMFSVWPASKRLNISLDSEGAFRKLGMLFTAWDAFELDNLPLTNNFKWRALGVYLRRWREVLEAGRLFFNAFVLRKPFVYRDQYRLTARSHQKSTVQ
jgi:UDP-MurNAc hydroxylase